MPGGDMSTQLASTGQKIDYTMLSSIQAVYASTGGGVPRGTISLAGSNDNVNFVTIAGSTTAITGSGSGIWNINGTGYDYIQGQFVPIAGSSGQLTLTLYSKGF